MIKANELIKLYKKSKIESIESEILKRASNGCNFLQEYDMDLNLINFLKEHGYKVQSIPLNKLEKNRNYQNKYEISWEQ